MPSSSSSSSPARSEQAAPEAGSQEAKDAPFYCPGCGKRVMYQQQCTGQPASPHPPIEVVSTDELSGDPEKFTAAPNTD